MNVGAKLFKFLLLAWATSFAVFASAMTLTPSTLPAGAVGIAYTPIVTASGGVAPYTYLAFTGTVPPGVSLGGAGAFSGVPTTAGAYTFTLRVTDAVTAVTDFVVTINIAATNVQIISFPPIPDHYDSDPIFELLATGGPSGNPVTFTSTTPTVCNVATNLVRLTGTLGVCSIVANQAGDATFLAASPVVRSFNVVLGHQAPPTNLSCTTTGRKATCSFAAPIDNGSPAISGYLVKCTNTAGVAVSGSGAGSPISVSNLTVGITYSCAAATQNASGTGAFGDGVDVVAHSKLALNSQIDSDGDGKGELWARNGNATLKFRASDSGDLIVSSAAVVDLQSTVLGFGDFSGAGSSAILLQNQFGDVRVNFGADGAPDSDVFSRNVKSGWRVDAIADIDGDGKSDIVWRYATPDTPDTGVVYVWFMNGATVAEVKARGGAPLSWNMVGAADLNGDGMADLIWQSPAGDLRSLTAKAGRTFVNEKIGTVPLGFNLIAAADFDGDGKADLVFRNSATGEIRLWTQNGLQTSATYLLPATDPAWQFVSATDMDGDGVTDLVWLTPGKSLIVWYMIPGSLASPTVVYGSTTVPTGYQFLH